jgi:hypothetical protein
MPRSRGSSCARLLLAATLPGCVADPTSLGDPPATETSSDPGTTQGDDEPGATGQVTHDDGGTSTAGDGEPTTTGDTDPSASTGDAGTSTEDGGTTGDPLDAAMVIFVNFDGVVLTPAAVDDASLDQSVLGDDIGMPLGGYGVGPLRDEIMTAMAGYWAPFDVGVTSTRPASGDYTMIVVTPTNPFGGGVRGIAPLDCDDANHRTVGLVFASIDDGTPPEDVAAIITHVVADGMGLEHTDGGGFTNPFLLDGYSFVDACVPIVGEPLCVAQHAPFCPAGQQNAFAELSAWFPP